MTCGHATRARAAALLKPPHDELKQVGCTLSEFALSRVCVTVYVSRGNRSLQIKLILQAKGAHPPYFIPPRVGAAQAAINCLVAVSASKLRGHGSDLVGVPCLDPRQHALDALSRLDEGLREIRE